MELTLVLKPISDSPIPLGGSPNLGHKTFHIVVVTFPQPSLALSDPLSPSPDPEFPSVLVRSGYPNKML